MANKTKKHRFNAVDAILIIALLAIVCVAVFIIATPDKFGFGSEKEAEKEKVMLEYKIEFRAVREELKEVIDQNFAESDSVFEVGAGYRLGELISAITDKKAVYTGVNLENGQKVSSEYEDKYDITFVIRAEAEITDLNRYSLGGCEISVGTGVNVRLPYFTYKGYCTAITEITEDVKEAQ